MKRKYLYMTSTGIISLIIFGWFVIQAQEAQIPKWYELFESRNKEICETYKPENAIFSTEKFPNLHENIDTTDAQYTTWWNDLEIAQSIYINNVNNIYACAMISAQERSISFIMDTLWESKKTWAMNKAYTAQLENIKRLKKENECLNTQKSTKQLNHANILNQVTYQLCEYHNYLEYLREYNSMTANIIQQDKNKKDGEKITQNYNISEIIRLEKEKKSLIDNEIKKAYELYPIALKTYSEYESNLPIHDLMTLIQKDYVDLRLELHKNLNPINQVVYKISNAMKE